MAQRIAINGFGRMGRLSLRAGALDKGLSFVAINEIAGDMETAAHLLEFDSVHGRWDHSIDVKSEGLAVTDHHLAFTSYKSPSELPWSGDDVDIVLECSGKFRTWDSLKPYFDKGIKKVIVAAPVKDERALNIVVGVNHGLYDPDANNLLTAASCTTNCLAPVVKIMHEGIGITHGSITTIHDVTNTQVMVDAPKSDLRRARSGLTSLIPTTTGSAKAIADIFPELSGKLNGHAVRVPLLNASLADCVFEMQRDTDVEEVNALLRNASETVLADILGYEERPLVSVDFLNDPRSGIIDAPSTMVVNKRQVKLYVWYDNEWGYANRMIDIAAMVARSLG